MIYTVSSPERLQTCHLYKEDEFSNESMEAMNINCNHCETKHYGQALQGKYSHVSIENSSTLHAQMDYNISRNTLDTSPLSGNEAYVIVIPSFIETMRISFL